MRRWLTTGMVALVISTAGVVSGGIASADPAPPPAITGVPTPDAVAGILTRLTDPGVGYQDKAGLVENGIAPDEGQALDQELDQLNRYGALPYSFAVTDIQPAPNNLAGATVGVTGPKMSIPQTGPIVLVEQGDGWLLTHDSATYVMQQLGRHDRRRHHTTGAGPPLPPFNFSHF